MNISNKLGKFIFIAIYFALFSSSCNGILPPDPLAAATPTPTPLPIEQPVELLDISQTAPVNLVLWVPPEFGLSLDSDSSRLLNDRIAEFRNVHPNVQIDVRVKAQEGPADLLESIAAAQDAAPLSLPDLVLLPTEDMQTAAIRKYIQPIGEFIPPDYTEDKYGIALELGAFQNEIYGMTFAMDALVMAYHPEIIETPPSTWTQAMEIPGVLAFPAANSRSLFTLALYLAQTESIIDENNKISLDAEILESVYTFYENGQENNLFPFWLTQYETESLSWQAFLDGRASMAITTASTYLKYVGEINASPIPTEDGAPFTLTSGWVFSLIATDPDKVNSSIELANFLTDSVFSGTWTESAGYLPPRPSALTEWNNDPPRALANLILSSAGEIPSARTLNLLGEKLMQGTINVLKQEQTANEATLDILDNFTN